jgi:hypothetical protein
MFTNNLESIFPYVVPASWVGHAGSDSLISWGVSSDVFIVLVFDGNGTVRNVRPEDLLEMRLDEGEAFQIAAHNLAKAWHAGKIDIGIATLLDGTKIGCARRSWMAPAAAMILGDFHSTLAEQFGGTDFVAVAVNQECLFAFSIDETILRSESLRLAIDDEFNGHRKPISRQLNGEWPQQYSGQQLF